MKALIRIVVCFAVLGEVGNASIEYKTISCITGFAERDVVNSSEDEKLDRILFVADVLKISRQEVCSDREYWRVPWSTVSVQGTVSVGSGNGKFSDMG